MRALLKLSSSQSVSLSFLALCGIYKSAPRWRKSANDGSKTSCALPHRSRGQVSVGFHGVKSKKSKTTTPYYNRFSCCHGADDAYARIYGYFKRQLARVSVRAAMLVRLRALDVVLGRSPRPESLMDRKEAKRAKATRLAAVDVVSESGIPADRGSFGA